MKLQDIQQAKERLSGVIHNIPLEYTTHFSKVTGGDIYLKFESRQKTGSFKVRGAYNKIAKLVKTAKPPSIICASLGNHAQGVAYAASKSGIPTTIVMPKSAPLAKVTAVQGYGVDVVLHGDFFDDAQAHAKELEKKTGAVFIEPFNDYDVIAGQGTIGLEILEDLADVDIVVVPVGGGGLLSGVAVAIKSINCNVKVIGVQAEKAAAMVQSYKNKKLTTLNQIYTIADGIAVKRPGSLTYPLIQKYVDQMVTVTDDEIASTVIGLIERTKQVVEPAGASSLAAVICNKINVKGKKVVCLLSGGNIDVGIIHKIIERGLIKRGRQISLAILLQDKPGGLERVSGIIAKTSANVIGVRFDRTSVESEINDVILHVTCEVSGEKHSAEVVSELNKAGFKVL
ncbi:MAG: threonine ammonia-lyase [Firmicutes bacterium]|nr:threonine ammonia-lyase [Bacillota bacterium]